MTDEDLALHVLKAAESLGQTMLVEVRLEEMRSRQITIKSSEVENITESEDAGMNVRVFLPSGIGFASSNKVSKAEGERLAKSAFKQAKSSKKKSPIELSPEPAVKTSWDVKQKRRLMDVSTEERLAYLRGIDSSALKTGAKVQGRFYELRDSEVASFFANSEGSRISSFRPVVKFGSYNLVSVKGETEQFMCERGGTGGWERVEEWDLVNEIRREVAMLKQQIEKGKKVKPGVYDLVCGPEVVGIASHESCGHPMEADRILGREMSQAGRSFVSPEMIESRIGSEYATVIDDPTVPGSYGYYAYDAEGVKARPRHLYKDGRINEFLHNRETAGKLGIRSNGSSRAETYMKEPIVRMGNTFVAPGDFEEDEITGSIKNGVLMNSFTEWNIDDKRYNQKYVSREAYFVEDGEVTGPARKCILEITTPGFWGAIDAVTKKVKLHAGECGKGDPMQGVAVDSGGPMIRLRGVTLK